MLIYILLEISINFSDFKLFVVYIVGFVYVKSEVVFCYLLVYVLFFLGCNGYNFFGLFEIYF